jgi:ubiquinone/menaquinone biosynthesis C-methylase UbiE
VTEPADSEIARFDRWAPGYDRGPGQIFFRAIHRPVARALSSAPSPPRRVADLGCGTGRLLDTLRPLLPEAELFGIDPSQGMIAVARARFGTDPRVHLEVAAADRLPLGDGSVDVVTTTLSFHHWEHQAASLGEVARVLRPGGRLLLADILGIGVIGRLLRPHGNRHGSGYRTAAELDTLLGAAGFPVWRRRSMLFPGVPIYLVEAVRAAGRSSR